MGTGIRGANQVERISGSSKEDQTSAPDFGGGWMVATQALAGQIAQN